MSSHNPFRRNLPTSNPTGASASSDGLPLLSDTNSRANEARVDASSSSGSTLTSAAVDLTSSSAPEIAANSILNAGPSSSQSQPPHNPGRRIVEEEPPAYSPTPDAYQGESTLEYGPQRPFQPPSAPPPFHPPPQMGHHQGGWSHIQNQARVSAQRPLISPGDSIRAAWQQISGQLSSQASSTNPGNSYNQYHVGSQPTEGHINERWTGYPGQQHLPAPLPHFPPQPRIVSSPSLGPPPGAIVYPAGDSRIGGRLCWRCNGKGIVNFMLFDQEQCNVCGGIGRVFG